MNVQITRTSITEFPAEAIQNAANALLIHGAGVAGAIRKAAPVVQLESTALIEAVGPRPVGSAVTTGADPLPAEYVIHAITMPKPGGETSWPDAHEATVATLRQAQLLHIESVSLCALGTGHGGLSFDACASAMVKALISDRVNLPDDFTVTFALFGDEAVEAFAERLTVEGIDPEYV